MEMLKETLDIEKIDLVEDIELREDDIRLLEDLLLFRRLEALGYNAWVYVLG